MMFRILKILLVMTVVGQSVGTEETALVEDVVERKFLAIAECEVIYEHLCPTSLCSVESAMRQTTRRGHDWTPAHLFCDAACMRNDGCRTICNCADKRLGKTNPFPAKSDEQGLSNPVLHCREQSFMSVKWEYSGNGTKEEPVVFAIEIRDYGDRQWKPYTLTRKNITLIEGLIPRQKYRYRVFAVGPSGVNESPTVSELIPTLPPISDFQSGMTVLDPPSNLQLIGPIKYSSDGATVRLGWKPGNDFTCTYELMWHVHKPKDGKIPFPHSTQISVVEKPMELEIEGLYLDHVYIFFMRTRIDGYEVESNTTNEVLQLVIKDCLSAFDYNLTICRPPAPAKLNLQVYRTSVNTTQVSVSWTSVKGHPSGYNISLYDPNVKLIDTKLVPGTDTHTTFANVPLETNYLAKVSAYSPSGLGAEAVKLKKLKFSQGNKTSEPAKMNVSSDSLPGKDTKPILSVEKAETHDHFWTLLSTGVGGSLAVVFCIIVSIRHRILRRCLRKIYKIPEIPQGCAMVRPESGPEPEPEPENEPDLCERIGEGAFGTVWLARFSVPGSQDAIKVAVKMLKENPSSEDVRNFDNEMAILRSANRHPNVIRLIACLTKTPKKMIIMELCPFGDLKEYLNEAWRELIRAPSENLDRSSAFKTSINSLELRNCQALANKMYEILLAGREKFSKELISFARQIASGMESLAESGILHRDLAARNILIAGDRTIRISDFGLSREVLETSIYTKRGCERVPYKWVAPEAVKEKVFTTKSDVWSYGITLWEIVTLGSSPYAFISDVSSYLQYLLRGERMPQPCNCSDDLYEWMLLCWNKEPEGRPTFQLLREHMENLERSGEQHISLDRYKIRSFRYRHLERIVDEDETETDVVALEI